MTLQFRRVVTGHDKSGLAVVKEDKEIVAGERLPGYFASTVWCTTQFPVDNDEHSIGDSGPGEKGSRVLMRIGEMRADAPASHQMHRTESLDYAVILSGECEMRLDSGETVKRLKAGDVVIQRGTNHAWIPVGSEPCRFLFVLIDAKPVICGDKVLGEFLDNFAGQIHPQGTDQYATVGKT